MWPTPGLFVVQSPEKDGNSAAKEDRIPERRFPLATITSSCFT